MNSKINKAQAEAAAVVAGKLFNEKVNKLRESQDKKIKLSKKAEELLEKVREYKAAREELDTLRTSVGRLVEENEVESCWDSDKYDTAKMKVKLIAAYRRKKGFVLPKFDKEMFMSQLLISGQEDINKFITSWLSKTF